MVDARGGLLSGSGIRVRSLEHSQLQWMKALERNSAGWAFLGHQATRHFTKTIPCTEISRKQGEELCLMNPFVSVFPKHNLSLKEFLTERIPRECCRFEGKKLLKVWGGQRNAKTEWKTKNCLLFSPNFPRISVRVFPQWERQTPPKNSLQQIQ